MFFKKLILILFILIFIKNCFSMERSEQDNLEDNPESSLLHSTDSHSINSLQSSNLEDLNNFERLCLTYLTNPVGVRPEFPNQFKKARFSDIQSACLWDMSNWLKCCFLKLSNDQKNLILKIFDTSKNSLMHYCAKNLSINCAKILLENNCPFSLLNENRESIFVICLLNKDKKLNIENKKKLFEFFNIIKSKSQNYDWDFLINTPNKLGIAPLYLAVKYWDIEVVKFLLENGANPDGISEFSRVKHHQLIVKSPIFAAVRLAKDDSEYINIIKLLLKFKVDVEVEDDNGNTPLKIAEKFEDQEVAHLLWNKKVNISRAWPYGDDDTQESDNYCDCNCNII